MTHIYKGDRLTDPALKNMPCDAVRRSVDAKCIRGRNGSMLVKDAQGTVYNVIGRLLRKVK